MGTVELIFVSVALSMDSFAVSLSKGLTFKKRVFGHIFLMALIFAIFQTGMPLLGWFCGIQFEDIIAPYGKYITFGIFMFLGVKMLIDGIKDARDSKKNCAEKCEEAEEEHKYFKKMPVVNHLIEFSLLGLATSIDAFVMGISFAALHVEMLLASCLIFAATFIFSVGGGWFGSFLGKKLTYYAQIAGAIILILLAIKALLV